MLYDEHDSPYPYLSYGSASVLPMSEDEMAKANKKKHPVGFIPPVKKKKRKKK